MITIYCHTNTENGKKYIGQTKRTIEKRWKDHLYSSKNPKYPFHFAIQKYGPESFIGEILRECEDQKEANIMEEYYKDVLWASIDDWGYTCITGNGKCTVSEETKQKISASKKGEKNSFYGKQHSRETREVMSLVRTGKIQTQETKDKRAKARTGKKCSEETKIKIGLSSAKTYFLISPDNIKREIRNLRKFCSENNLKSDTMYDVVRGKQKQHKGWRLNLEKYPSITFHPRKRREGKIYYFISPKGEYLVVRNLAEFCRENNLRDSHMYSVAAGKRDHHKGWILDKNKKEFLCPQL